MTRGLLVLGCGGHGRVVADAATECGYTHYAFLDDAPQASGKSMLPGLVLGPMAMMEQLVREWGEAIVAVGNCSARLTLFERLRSLGFETPSIVHPSAVISRNADIGSGVFVAAAAVVSVGAKIGEATIVNTGARVDHDCEIGRGCHIAPGATLSGGVRVGERTWLGTGCAVRQGVTIGADVLVGVGAAVVTDLESGKTYVGVPARIHTKQMNR
ncbi:MAG TPA: acetyltransferase [Hyphomicrobium sp.]|nr:acetyltransferase [Hyphomicrobium sp.]